MGECAETIHNLEHEPCEPISKGFCLTLTRIMIGINGQDQGIRHTQVVMNLLRVSKNFSWGGRIESPNGWKESSVW